ncbi:MULTISPECIES: hypothetical protein [Streptococcus]|uniref:hypothetical protein n=1 Tax=Streptococcus TaxID=1301 RepID=UPI00099C229C|nr:MULTISPECIES: hypothetical protein [Streptococcus]MBW8142979.1 hypothetical protein [Streptococcus pseudopneumoniae]MDS9311628.1 hypothetical protein [Streptococcus pseudopneumoniae]QBX10406.1 hypothetical protein JavanS435_0007 [Streptococcus satellite phage Javan435]
MTLQLFKYTERYWNKEDFEKEVNDFMATVEVVDIKISGNTTSEPFASVAVVLVLYR